MLFTFIVGNHDTMNKNKYMHSLGWLKAFGSRVKVVTFRHHDPDMKLSFLSYTESKEEIERFFENAQPTCFMHQGLASVPMGSGFLINEILTLDMIPDHVKHVYLGHYHSHRRVSDKATVIGTPLQLTWADEGDTRGFLIIDAETGECEQIECKAPKFVTIDQGEIILTDEVEDNFIKVINYNESCKEDIRKALIKDGARSVEFVKQAEPIKRLYPLPNESEFHLPTLVNEYEKLQQVTPERSKVGKEIMG
jgi:DNA repair exonuclease SbcCD nuclease subunit